MSTPKAALRAKLLAYVPAGPFPVGTFIIKAGESDKVSEHFRRSEFYSTSPRSGYGAVPSHPIYKQLVNAAEILRTHFNTPWRITSGFRTGAHEVAILDKSNASYFISQHMKGKAFDSQPANNDPKILAAIHADFIAGGELYQKLRKAGITAFGLYDTFIHLDCRDDEFHAGRKDEFGSVAWWDSRSHGTTAKKSWGSAYLAPLSLKTPKGYFLAENRGVVVAHS